jgi:glucose-6-phosphate isomerase
MSASLSPVSVSASPLAAIAQADLCVPFSVKNARLGERPAIVRRLSDLRSCFMDKAAVESRLACGEDSVLYTVTSVEPASGEGQLHYGLGVLYPGRVGDEYFMTKGHLHAHRAAAEIYVGLSGEGAMLLEDEASGETRLVSLRADTIVYVPGHTAHRTVNTGTEPLVYLGIYPASAGHDYGAIARNNFSRVVLRGPDGRPVLKLR